MDQTLKSLRRLLATAFPVAACLAYLAVYSTQAQVRPSGPAQGRVKGSAPSLKKPNEKEGPPPTVVKKYDRARNVTYVNVLIPSLTPPEGDSPVGEGRAPARRLDLTFQLVYKGASTADLAVAYLIVESGAETGQGPGLSKVEQVEVGADGYKYSYGRVSYGTKKGEEVNAPDGIEVLTFKLPPDDLPRIASAGALEIGLGGEVLKIKSTRLSELRRILLGGTE